MNIDERGLQQFISVLKEIQLSKPSSLSDNIPITSSWGLDGSWSTDSTKCAPKAWTEERELFKRILQGNATEVNEIMRERWLAQQGTPRIFVCEPHL